MKYLLVVAGTLQLLQGAGIAVNVGVEGKLFTLTGIGAPLLFIAAGALAMQVFLKGKGHVLLYVVNSLLIGLLCMGMAVAVLLSDGQEKLLTLVIVAMILVPISAMVGAAAESRQKSNP